MGLNLLFFISLISSCWHYPGVTHANGCLENNPVKKFWSTLSAYSEAKTLSLEEISKMLLQAKLNDIVIDKVLMTLKCAQTYHLQHTHILTVIDYSKPSNEKRLWVFDLDSRQLLFHTYVSHGITSGKLFTEFFSNKNNSKASSLGVYKTNKTYYGRDGLSLRLDGLDKGFNDNASMRAIVIHGGWYVDESFIKKYGRAGRSWGCPALPTQFTQSIINTIKNESLMVVYYPTDVWFAKSKFLTCEKFIALDKTIPNEIKPFVALEATRDDVLLTNVVKNKEYILTMPARNYQKVFNTAPPLTRMLRRQVNNQEFIALSTTELEQLISKYYQSTANASSNSSVTVGVVTQNIDQTNIFDNVFFVAPEVKHNGGYNRTEMKIVDLGKITEITQSENTSNLISEENTKISPAINNQTVINYTVNFKDHPSINLQSTNRFIRWLGL